MNTGAARRLTSGHKNLRTFRQGRVNARRYLVEENRMRSVRSRRLQKKLETSFRKDLRIIINEIKSGVRPDFDASLRRKENEIRAAVSAETKKLFTTIIENNQRKYKPVLTKSAVDLGLTFDRSDWVNRYTREYLFSKEPVFAGISRSMSLDIFRDVASLEQEGLGVDAIARQLNRKHRNIGRNRAALIARTETHNASGFAQHNYHQDLSKNGIQMAKQWVATLDQRTRSSHATMNGTQVLMDEPFLMPNGREMQYVGDSNGGAANVINCRCVIVYVDVEDDVTDSKVPEQQPPADSGDEFEPVRVDKFGRPQNNVSQAQFAKQFSGMSAAALSARGRASVDRIRERLKATEESYGEYHKKNKKYRQRFTSDFQEIKDLPEITDFDEPLVPIAMERIMDELDAICDHFKIPHIRGYKKTITANADMGDGVMGISPNLLGGMKNGLTDPSYRAPVSKWKMGDSKRDRPRLAKQFDAEAFERFRSTMYHELAHHIHQTWGYNFLKAGDNTWFQYADPKIEKLMFRRRNWRGTGATDYSDANMMEWFAENFTLWARGKEDLVAPRFKKFIEDLASGVDVDAI